MSGKAQHGDENDTENRFEKKGMVPAGTLVLCQAVSHVD